MMKGDCENCTQYDVSCDGQSRYELKITQKGIRACANRDFGEMPRKSVVQVAAFHSLYRAKIRYGMDSLQAFVEAIVQTSDTVFKKVKKDNAYLINMLDKRIKLRTKP